MRNYLTLSCRIRYCMTQQLFGSTFLKMVLPNKDCWKTKKQGLTSDRSLLLGSGGGHEEFQLFSLCDILFFLACCHQPGQQDPRCSLRSEPPEVTSANTHGAFKRVGKGILERDDLFFQQRPYAAGGGAGRGGLLGYNQWMWSTHGAFVRVEKAF